MFRNNRKRTIPLLLLGVAVSGFLGACATNPDAARRQDRTAGIDGAMARAGDYGPTGRPSAQALAELERDYKKNSANASVALEYARALRAAAHYTRASIVLSPFAREEKSPAATKAEFAAVQLEMGDYQTAEDYARKAILQDPENFQAFHVLGISLDAQGHHKQAEVAFRKGLDLWQGDPTPIMNNLALNLASQGELDEASEILRRASAAAPGRAEVERNLRIVTALQNSTVVGAGHKVPLPQKKPGQ